MDPFVGTVVGFVVGVIGLFGAVTFALMAAGNRAAREGRGEEQLLVAPRGARFGEATELVLAAARAQEAEREQQAEVVHLHEVRARTADAHGHAA